MSQFPQIAVPAEPLSAGGMALLAANLPPEFRLQTLPMSAFRKQLTPSAAQLNALNSWQKLLRWPVSGIVLPRADNSEVLKAEVQHSEEDLPVITEQALSSPQSRQQFIEAVSARSEFDAVCADGCSAHDLIRFHSRYKYLLLSHSQPLYRELGPLVADMASWPSPGAFALMYRHKLMALLRCPPTRENHTNVLMHIQGYFRPHLSGEQRQALAATIDRFRLGELPLSVPIAALKACLAEFPHEWIASQRYLFPYLPSEADKKSMEEE